MAKHATPHQRSAWFRWHIAHDRNVTTTCAHFGIARSTFYRWWRRRQERQRGIEDQVRELLGDKPRRRPTTRRRRKPGRYWTEINLVLVARLDFEHPRWGRRQVQLQLAAHGFPMSEATVGRMLRVIRQRCPICHRREGHDELVHTVREDLLDMKRRW